MSDQLNEEQEHGEGARLRKLAVKKRFEELEAAWTEAIEADSVEPDDLLSVLEKTARGADPGFVESLLWFLLSERTQQKGAADALAVAKKAVPIFPESEMLRSEIASLCQAAHAAFAGIDALVASTILDNDTPLPEAAERMDKFIALTPGTYVLDPNAQHAGEVAAFNADTGSLDVTFEDRTRSYDVAALGSLELLDPDDFRALFAFDPEKLQALAQDEPDELVTRTLRAFGPRMTFKTLKSRLAEIVPAKAWAKWWAKAKLKLQQAAWVEMSGSKSQPTFALRKQPIPYEARLKALFNSTDDAWEKLKVVGDYLGEAGDRDPSVLEFFGRGLAALFNTLQAKEPAPALGALALASEIHEAAPDVVPAPDTSAVSELLDNADQPTLMAAVRNDDLARRTLDLVRETEQERWPEIFAALMPGCPQAGCEAAAEALCQNGHFDRVRSAAGEIFAHPERHIAALCWLWKAASAGKYADALGDVDLAGMAVHLFSVAHVLGRATAKKQFDVNYLLPQVRTAVAARDFAFLEQALKKAGVGRAQRIRTSVERHTGLSDLSCSRVHEMLRRTHAELFVEVIDPWEEDVIYTTEAGLQKRTDELQELVGGRMAEAARAVGEAAEDGDLSENFAWTAALAERDRLATTATRMQEEIRKARIITPEIAQSETVTVGSVVGVKEVATGEVSTMTFLGPWDADHDAGIVAYIADLGLAFMGKAVGDQVSIEFDGKEHTWEILAVRPGIQESDE